MGCTSSSPAAKKKSQEKRSAKPNVEKETAASPEMKDGGKASTATTAVSCTVACVPASRDARVRAKMQERVLLPADASQPVTVRRPSQAGATPDQRCTIASSVQGPVKGGTRVRGRVLESDTQVRMLYCLPVCTYNSMALMKAGAGEWRR